MTRNIPARANARRFAALLGTTALTLGLGGAAVAQEAAPDTVAEVVVTGSRAALAGFQAPTPTAVIGSATITQQAVTNVATILNQNPAFKGTRGPSGNAQNQASPAQATADLRGLGGQRTLVLVNGNRVVPFAPGSNLSVPTAVDLNLIPTIMIDRVEVVTGGASAQYGSDAVSGVVNLIMKNRFSGLEVRGQAGGSQRGDYHGYRLAAIGGTDFAGGKGHIVIGLDGYDNDGVKDSSKRGWASRLTNVYSNNASASNGLPALLNIADVRNANSVGGLITSGPLKGQTFTSPTTLGFFNPGTLNNGTTQVGGDGAPTNRGQWLVPQVRTGAAYSHIEYQLTDNIKAYTELSYAYSRGVLDSRRIDEGGIGGAGRVAVTIRGDNPYLPASVAALYNGVGGNPTSFSFVKQDFSLGGLGTYVTNKTPRALVALEGEIPDFGVGSNWKWDAHAEYGKNHYVANYLNTQVAGNGTPATGPQILSRVALATDAVLVTAANVGTSGLPIGSIQCRTTLSAPTNGCVPYNPFGPDSATAANRAYLNNNGLNVVDYTQQDAAFNLTGEPFALPAGPVSIAVGGEYRKEKENLKGDFYANLNAYATGNAPSFKGQFNVKEVYGEANAPILKDAPLAKQLNVQGAVRYADYSTVGSQTTWKLGVNYEPVSGMRFRVTESRDIRAPQLWELFAPGNAQSNNLTVRNRITNALETVFIPQNSSGGNPDAQPEKAKTKTFGLVLTPGEWLDELSGLDLSVDYYDINIRGALTSFSGANVATLCNNGDANYCKYFTYNATGSVTALNNPVVNLGGVRTKGVDFVLAYRKDLSQFNSALKGRWTQNFSGSYVAHVYVDSGIPGSPIVDRAGDNGQNAQSTGGAQPKFRGNLTETYDLDKLSITLGFLYVSKGRLDNTYNIGNASTQINNNDVKPYLNTNLFASYQLTPKLQLFGAVQNLFDTDPANSPYAVLNTSVSGAYYDKIGRQFQLGFDYKF
jgi:outer membrane receptor protein involved in Fe transport